jgi:hypothetical protein
VRHEVLPALHASSHGTLGFRTSLESLRRDSDALEEITNSAWSAALLQRPADTGIYIRRAILCEFPDAIVARVLHRAARSVGSTWSTSTLDHAMRDIRSGHQARICIRSGIVELSKQGIHVEFVQERGTRAVDTRSTQAIEVLGSKSGRIPWFDRSIAWSPFPESDSNPDPLGSHVCSIQTGRYFIQGPGEADTFSGPGQTTRRIRTILRRLDVAEHELWRWPCLFWESKDGSTRICQWIYGVADAGCETPTAAAEKSSNRVILSIDQRIANNLQPP